MISRNIIVNGRRTSMRLEDELWDALKDIAQREYLSLNALFTQIDAKRGKNSLTSATRVFVISYYQDLVDVQQPRALSAE